MVRPDAFLTGLFFLAVGSYGVLRPYAMARFTEQVDALGSRRDTASVEPTDWSVRLTRVVSAVAALCGAAIVGLAFAPGW